MIQQLKKRWNSDDGQRLLKVVIESLMRGKPLGQIAGLTTINGRLDLRGVTLSSLEKQRDITVLDHTLTQHYGSLKVKNVTVESVDFSYSDISYSYWERAVFKDCLFVNTEAKRLHVVSCDFRDCTFEKANLSYSLLNMNIGVDSGSFNNVEFIESNLSECSFCFPVMDGCVFRDCKLVATNFDGSRMENCRFIGKVDSPWFRGYSKNASRSWLWVFNRVDVTKFPNPMKNVDFSEANLIGVSFRCGIDLGSCIFPVNENYYIMIRDLANFYSQLRLVINDEWNGEDRRIALHLIDNVHYTKESQNQPLDFIDKYLLVESFNEAFAHRFFELIKHVQKEMLGTR